MPLNLNVLNNFIQENDCIIVGVSGGADSMCLLDLINKYKCACKFKIYAVHINHGIRGDEALRDQNFVSEFCEKRNINCIIKSVDAIKFAKENSKTLEQAARILRYDVFENLIKELNANKLFVAHHKDDQAETILMHILRGSGLKGAKGMLSNSNKIYRPLLNISRKEIEEYNRNNGIEFLTDSTNFDNKHVRNYIRNKIIPELCEIYPNVVNALCGFAENCEKDDEFINLNVDFNKIKRINDEIYLNINETMHYSIISRMIRFACEELGVYADIEQKHIKDVVSLIDKQNGKSINLPHNLVAIKDYDNIIISLKKEEMLLVEQDFKLGVIEFGEFGNIIVEKVEAKVNYKKAEKCLYVDLDKIPSNAIIRFRKDGDKFKKFGGGEKNLSDYFIDKKVSKRKRDYIPVVASGNKVLVVLGVEISDAVKVTQETKNVARIKIQ